MPAIRIAFDDLGGEAFGCGGSDAALACVMIKQWVGKSGVAAGALEVVIKFHREVRA